MLNDIWHLSNKDLYRIFRLGGGHEVPGIFREIIGMLIAHFLVFTANWQEVKTSG